MPFIHERVKQLLGSLGEPLSAEQVKQNFGYNQTRLMFADPNNTDQTILRVSSTDPFTDTASPSAQQEMLMQMGEVKRSALDAAGNDDVKNIAVINFFNKLCEKLLANEDAKANLFEPADSKQNKAFGKQLKKNAEILAEFMDVACKIVDVSREELDAIGHARRSKSRPTIVHEFSTTETKAGETQFIIYEPAGRLTKNQMQVLGTNSPFHATTSHQKSGLVQGNSSFVRMLVGTKHANGSVTIHHDSFSGPGARMPYEDLKGADLQKRMAVKATTFLNQEEIIQALAQRIYEKHLVGKSDLEIQQYFNEHPLSETYMQVTTPTQGQVIPFGFDGDQNLAQFEFVRDAIRAFDGVKALPISINKGNGTEIDINVGYKGHHAAFGVNIGGQLLPQWVEGAQNKRFMNEMLDETVASLDAINLPGSIQGFNSVKQVFKEIQDSAVEVVKPANDTDRLLDVKDDLARLKSQYREAMVDYIKIYKSSASQNDIQGRLARINDFETRIKVLEDRNDQAAASRNAKVEESFKRSHATLESALATFKTQAEAMIKNPSTSAEDKAKIKSAYNQCAYLRTAQSLYFSGNWRQDKHSFELQALLSSLSTELDHGNTKGCKSNNDRGQRLAQQIAGNALVTSMSDTGLFSGEYFQPKNVLNKTKEQRTLAEQIDTQLPTIQALHHTANAGVAGGKFELRNKQGFADNELLGKPAKLAKLKSVGNKVPLYKNPKFIGGLVVGAVVGAVAVITVIPAIAIASVAVLAGVAAATVYAGSIIKAKFDKWQAKKILKQQARAEIDSALETVAEATKPSTAIMSQRLGPAIDVQRSQSPEIEHSVDPDDYAATNSVRMPLDNDNSFEPSKIELGSHSSR